MGLANGGIEMKKTALAILLCFVSLSALAAGKPQPAKQAKPTKETVLALADKYTKACEPKLQFKDKQTIADIRTKLFMSKGLKSETDKTVDSLVNQLTIALASLKSFNTITLASCILVQTRPESVRTANLFASILHTSDKPKETTRLKDAVTVLEYAVILQPKSTLAKLNLANVYLDVNRDAEAKAIADKILFTDGENASAHRVLATYYYKKNNLGMFRQELLKAAKFKGFVKQKTDKKNKKIEEEKGEMTDSTAVLEGKTQQLQDEVPFTTADILEDEYPSQAKQIRDHYCKLEQSAKMRMPVLPQCKTNSNEDYRLSEPIITAWVEAFAGKFKNYEAGQAASMGINVNASEEVISAQAQAAAQKKMAEAAQQAQQMMKYLQNMVNMPGAKGMKGVDKAELRKAMAELKQLSKQQGAKVEDKPVDMDAPPFSDSGTPWAAMNYENYFKISHTYESYFHHYYIKDYQPKLMDIYKVYGQKVEEENKHHETLSERLQAEHDLPSNPHGSIDEPCRREKIRHIKALNAIGLNYYQQWQGLYFPQYAQRMKPNLDAYWNVCMLYVRNMNDPKVMEREYNHVKSIYFNYALQAVGNISGGGGFKYEGSTDEEEAALQRDIEAAQPLAEEKKKEFEAAIEEPTTDWMKWIEDHFVVEVSGEFLSLKVTAKTIEFEAWAFGPGAGIKVDLVDEILETYTGVGAKLQVGVNIGGMDASIEAKGDFVRRTAKWDFGKGTYEETDSAKGEVKGAFGPLSASGEMEVDTALNAKVAGKITAGDTFTYQDQGEFKL